MVRWRERLRRSAGRVAWRSPRSADLQVGQLFTDLLLRLRRHRPERRTGGSADIPDLIERVLQAGDAMHRAQQAAERRDPSLQCERFRVTLPADEIENLDADVRHDRRDRQHGAVGPRDSA